MIMQIQWTFVNLRSRFLHVRNALSINAFGSLLRSRILCNLKPRYCSFNPFSVVSLSKTICCLTAQNGPSISCRLEHRGQAFSDTFWVTSRSQPSTMVSYPLQSNGVCLPSRKKNSPKHCSGLSSRFRWLPPLMPFSSIPMPISFWLIREPVRSWETVVDTCCPISERLATIPSRLT